MAKKALKENQEVKSGKQDAGYFETIYRVYYKTNVNGLRITGSLPVYFKSIETTDYASVSYKEIDPTHRTYDNFNDYFKCNNYNNFFKKSIEVRLASIRKFWPFFAGHRTCFSN